MSEKYKLLCVNLKLFDGDGGGGAVGATASGGTSSAEGTAQGEQGGATPIVYESTRRKGKQAGESKAVLYGKQTGNVLDAGGQNTETPIVDRKKAFSDMINGEYKDLYTEETQKIINKRFKETKALEEKVGGYQGIIDMLSSRYGIENGDIKGLKEALDGDNDYWQNAADEAGMTVDQYKRFQKLKAENDNLLKQREYQTSRERAKQQSEAWFMEAEQLKGKFPKFSLADELQNRDFISMLKSGVPMEHAYKVTHFDELMGNAIFTTAANAEKNVVANIRAKGMRPTENGISSQSSFTVKNDVSKLSKEDRREIARRVARGEIISF